MVGRRLARAGDAVSLAIILAILVEPVAWMALSAFKTRTEVAALPPKLIFAPTLDNFRELFGRGDFLDYTWNSLVVSGGSKLLGLASGTALATGMSSRTEVRMTW